MSLGLRRWFAIGLMALVIVPLGSTTKVSADPAAINLRVTSVEIASQIDTADNQFHDFVVLSGVISNDSAVSVDETLTLLTGPAIGTRSELADLIQKHDAKTLSPATLDPITIHDIAANTSKSWSLAVRADALWGNYASGVFPIGVSASNGVSRDIVAQPWFGNRLTLSATKLTTAVVLSSVKHFSLGQSDKNVLLSEATRISDLTSGQLRDQSFIVDNFVMDILASVGSPSATETAARINMLKTTSSVYGNSDLLRLNAGRQHSAIKRALELTPNTGKVLYLPNDEKLQISSFGARLDSVVVPVITNVSVTGDKLGTVDASGQTSSQKVLISDQGLNSCLNLQDPFSTQWCIASQLGMITAESPNLSRNILMLTPTNWSPNAPMRNAVARALKPSRFLKTESLSELLVTPPVTTVPININKPRKFESSLRKVEREVIRTQTSIENVFGTTDVSKSLLSVSVLLYSQDWQSAADAKHFGRSHTQQAHELLNQLRLEGSKHVTIPGTKASLPITIFNSSAYVAHVQVIVAGTGANRLTTTPSELVAVEPGNRVSVQIPITLNSAGDVQAVAYLADATGATFGDSLSIQIASTAYQQFARSLVWVALLALVLLVGNNVWRRTRNDSSKASA